MHSDRMTTEPPGTWVTHPRMYPDRGGGKEATGK